MITLFMMQSQVSPAIRFSLHPFLKAPLAKLISFIIRSDSHVSESVNKWMNKQKWVSERMSKCRAWMSEWMNEWWMNKSMNEWMNDCKNELVHVNEWMNEWANEWMTKSKREWMNESECSGSGLVSEYWILQCGPNFRPLPAALKGRRSRWSPQPRSHPLAKEKSRLLLLSHQELEILSDTSTVQQIWTKC